MIGVNSVSFHTVVITMYMYLLYIYNIDCFHLILNNASASSVIPLHKIMTMNFIIITEITV